jgi:predicted Zn-dependent protease
MIAEEELQRLIVEHELGHLLTRVAGHHADSSNLMIAEVGQLSPAG